MAGVAAWGIALLTIAAVIARYVFNYGISFSADFTTYLSCFACFIGASYCQWIKGHVNVDLITTRLSKKGQKWTELVGLILSLFVSLIYLYWVTIMVYSSAARKLRTMSPVPVPLAIPQLSIVIGLVFLVIILMVQIMASIKELRNPH
jgi:TRAP-type C4-dicarboxylate transport system permease small subunit